jgi:hypothetical protein
MTTPLFDTVLSRVGPEPYPENTPIVVRSGVVPYSFDKSKSYARFPAVARG